MSENRKFWGSLALVSLLAVAAGYALPRPAPPGGDMLDALAAVQRRSPRFLISEPLPRGDWVQTGAVYLCRTARTASEVESLSKHPSRPDPRWTGVVCFRGMASAREIDVPWISDGGERCLRYRNFAVFGDPEVLGEVRAILADAGFRSLSDPR